jgi:MscS family membrane protein
MAYRFADLAGEYLAMLASRTDSTLDDQIVKLVARTLKLFAVLTGIILAAQNLGFNVVSLLAGLSIGGLAVALAMQTTLTNFIGSIIIMVDRAFKVGDWIKIGEAEGDVEEVDFRCTRLRTFYDSVITIPNSEVMNSKIDNLGKRKHRRILTTLKIMPDTSPDKIERLVDGIKQIIAGAASTRKDLYHVVLKDFGPDCLEIMIYFFVKAPDLARELVERHRILLEVLRLAHHLEVRFAMPVQAIQLERPEPIE